MAIRDDIVASYKHTFSVDLRQESALSNLCPQVTDEAVREIFKSEYGYDAYNPGSIWPVERITLMLGRLNIHEYEDYYAAEIGRFNDLLSKQEFMLESKHNVNYRTEMLNVEISFRAIADTLEREMLHQLCDIYSQEEVVVKFEEVFGYTPPNLDSRSYKERIMTMLVGRNDDYAEKIGASMDKLLVEQMATIEDTPNIGPVNPEIASINDELLRLVIEIENDRLGAIEVRLSNESLVRAHAWAGVLKRSEAAFEAIEEAFKESLLLVYEPGMLLKAVDMTVDDNYFGSMVLLDGKWVKTKEPTKTMPVADIHQIERLSLPPVYISVENKNQERFTLRLCDHGAMESDSAIKFADNSKGPIISVYIDDKGEYDLGGLESSLLYAMRGLSVIRQTQPDKLKLVKPIKVVEEKKGIEKGAGFGLGD